MGSERTKAECAAREALAEVRRLAPAVNDGDAIWVDMLDRRKVIEGEIVEDEARILYEAEHPHTKRHVPWPQVCAEILEVATEYRDRVAGGVLRISDRWTHESEARALQAEARVERAEDLHVREMSRVVDALAVSSEREGTLQRALLEARAHILRVATAGHLCTRNEIANRAVRCVDDALKSSFAASRSDGTMQVGGQCDTTLIGERCELATNHSGGHRVESATKPGMYHRWGP